MPQRRNRDIQGLSLNHPSQANAIFAVLPNDAADRIRERVRFYDWNRAAGQVRWMCSLDTTERDVDDFVTAIREELAIRR
ncbi:MAG: threonine aldolase [Mycobacterium sp.]|nr:threonine aldolase [Mycobacterium sp.]